MRSANFFRLLTPLVLATCPVFLQIPALIHIFDSNPINIISGVVVGSRPSLLPGLPWIDPNYGTTVEAFGKLAADSWLRGEIPWWNPYSGIGLPLAAEMQPAALFLPFILLLHFSDGILYLRIVLQIIAGLGTWGLLREMRLCRLACLVGGLLYEFDGTFTWLPDAPCHPIAFLPLMLLGVERARKGHGVGWITLGLAGSLYAGFPETALADGLLVGVWSLCRLAQMGFQNCGMLFYRLVSAVALALLMAAPILWPFMEYLRQADVGLHLGGGWAHVGLPLPGYAMLLFPTIYGPIASFGYSQPSDILWMGWGQIGGYIGLATVLLAIAAVTTRRAEPLRWVLLGWVVLCVGKTANLPGLTELTNLIPGITLTAFFRYGEPSWTFAAIILAALAIDDWRRGLMTRRGIKQAACLTLAIAVVALVLALPTLQHLFVQTPSWRPFAVAALAWGAIGTGGIWQLFLRPPSRICICALAMLLGAEALGFAGFPLLSAPRQAKLDRPLIQYLQTHLGFARFVTLGPLQANLGAIYGLASINARSMPVATAWGEHVRGALDPDASPEDFGTTSEAALSARAKAYEQLSVAYVLTAPGVGFLPADSNRAVVPVKSIGKTPLWLAADQSVRGRIHLGHEPITRTVGVVGLEIGNSANSATGFLELELCNKLTCFSGQSGELQNMVDNGIAQVQLNGALPVQPDDELTYRITRVGGANSFALWLWPTAPDQDQFVLGPLGQLSRTGFRLTLQAPGSIANPVYADRTAAIYALPAPAPYASAENCQLEIASRTAMTANCSSPSRLVRREFFMPGWRATVEGRESPVTPQDTIFQSVALPAGVSHIVFGYAPPFVGWSYAAFCLGAVLLCLACWQQARQSAGHSWPWLPRAFWQAFRRRYAQPQ